MDPGGCQVILSRQALRDLKEITGYIARNDAVTALKIGNQLLDQAQAIGIHPLAGRVVREFADPQIRERVFRSWRIVYRVNAAEKRIVISRFWHAARDTPEICQADELP